MTDYLENSTPINVIPDIVQSFTEASMYVIESSNDDFFNVLEEAGMVDENGAINESAETEVLTESVKESAINALKSLWAKIQAFFAKVSKFFDEQVKKAKEHIQNILKKVGDKVEEGRMNVALKVEDAFELVPADKKLGKFAKININEESIASTYRAVEKAISDATSLTKQGELNEFASAKSKIEESLGGLSASAIKEHVRKTMVSGDSNGKSVTKSQITAAEYKNFIDVVLKGTDKGIIKKAYTAARKTINNSISDLNKFAKEGDKAISNKVVAQYATFCKSANQALHVYHSTVLGLARTRFVMYAHLLFNIITAAKAEKIKKARADKKAEKVAKKTEKTNESTEITLESLFEW